MHDGSATSLMCMTTKLASHLHLILCTIPPLLSHRIDIPGLTWLGNSNSNGDRCTLIGINQENTFPFGSMEAQVHTQHSLFNGNIVQLLCFPSLCCACHCHMNKPNTHKCILHKQVVCHFILCLITLNYVSWLSLDTPMRCVVLCSDISNIISSAILYYTGTTSYYYAVGLQLCYLTSQS